MINDHKNKCSVYIIAEAGVNHNGSIEMAKQLIEVAAGAGADAVKFQTFLAEAVISKNAPKAEYQMKTTDLKETQLDMVKKLELDEEAHEVLIAHSKANGIQFLSTPFDLESVELLAKIFDIDRLKIPSGEITNGPLLLKAATTVKPIIMSTGMSTIGEIETALGVLAFGYLQSGGSPSSKAFQAAYCSAKGQDLLREKVTLLHCTTAYPAPFDDVNLQVIKTLNRVFGLTVGYSDHTEGVAVSIAAVAMGAEVIEKHFTLNKNLPGPDHKSSLEPDELKLMIQGIRQVEKALGSSLKRPTNSEIINRNIARKSLVATNKIHKREPFTMDNLGMKRPGNGKPPMMYWDLMGMQAEKDYEPDDII